MISIDERQLERQVRTAVGGLVSHADTLRALADILEELGGTQADAAPVDLKRAVVACQSAAMQVVFTACAAIGLGDRMRVVAEIRDAAENGGCG